MIATHTTQRYRNTYNRNERNTYNRNERNRLQRSFMMSSIQAAKVKFIWLILYFYCQCSAINSFAQLCCWMYIYIRLPQRDQKRLFIYSFRLSVSIVFFKRRSVSFTRSVFFFNYSLMLPSPPLIDEVYIIVSSAYSSSILLNLNLSRVTCDFDSFEFIANFWLRVSISSEANMIPDIAEQNAMTLPRYEVGMTSPQPMVPMVMMMHQTEFPKFLKASLFQSESFSI